MRILGIDMGSKRIGVAVSDELGITAHALTTIKRKNNKEDLSAVCALIEEYGVQEVVIGFPKHLDGRPSEEASSYVAFGEKIHEKTGITVTYWDERLTTIEAERALLEGDVRRRKRKQLIDRVAACLILENYLAWRNKQGGARG
ncbi:MAG TPA: Holliday junction resolvase RuvX [Syntrophaceticus sp.]|nr:Holliday junction resolvase RuvX [Syntrophaceticus sp.]